MKKLSLPETVTSPAKPSQFAAECWFDDACILDMDYFVKTLSSIKAKGVRHDLIGSVITHYASKWLPDVSGGDVTQKCQTNYLEESQGSVTASWMKKRFFVETIVGVLPPEKDTIPCNFLLRLLRTANMVGVEPTYIAELERRISWQLDHASLKELMIPSFSYKEVNAVKKKGRARAHNVLEDKTQRRFLKVKTEEQNLDPTVYNKTVCYGEMF